MKQLLTLMLLVPAFAWGRSDNPDFYRKLAVEEYAQKSPDLLALPDELLPHLKKLKRIRGRENRVEALHHLLFDEDQFDILYDARQTLTAAQVFRFRRGNCLGLSSLYVAAARYLNLEASFQTVEIPATWEKRESFFIVPGHINVGIDLYQDEFNVEFLAVLANSEDIRKTTRISDERALAEYHNNIGMEYIDAGYPDIGEWHLRKAVEIEPSLAFVWSNLGVLCKRRGEYELAVQYYKKALDFDRDSSSALSNLYILYREQGETQKAAELVKKVQRHHRHNPYHLGQLAETDIRIGDYDAAIRKLKKAIKINEEIPRLHHLLGISYFHTREYLRSQDELEQAQNLASLEDRDRYDKKLEVLERYIGKTSS